MLAGSCIIKLVTVLSGQTSTKLCVYMKMLAGNCIMKLVTVLSG